MNNILSNRLLAISNMIDSDQIVYDIGCDHAYLDIYLTLYRHIKCYAIDVRKSVIEIAKKNISSFNLDIPVILNNGIDNIELLDNSILVLAGMGTRTILKILNNKDFNSAIIQSNDDLPLLRATISKWSYKIVDEQVVFEDGYFYVLIKIQKGVSHYTDEELLLGSVLMLDFNNDVYLQYLDYLNKKLTRMINNIPKEFSENRNKLIIKQNIIKNYLGI